MTDRVRHQPLPSEQHAADRLPAVVGEALLLHRSGIAANVTCCLCGAHFIDQNAIGGTDATGENHVWHLRCAARAAIKAERS